MQAADATLLDTRSGETVNWMFVLHTVKQNPSLSSFWPLQPTCPVLATDKDGAADRPQVPAPHSPTSQPHFQPWAESAPDEQRAAPVPGALQTVSPSPAHPLPACALQTGAGSPGHSVVPGPHSLLLKGEAEVDERWGGWSYHTQCPPTSPRGGPRLREKAAPSARSSHVQEAPGPQPPSAGLHTPGHSRLFESPCPGRRK